MEVYNKSDLLYGWSFSVGKNRPHDLIYYEGRFIVMVFIIRVRILYFGSLAIETVFLFFTKVYGWSSESKIHPKVRNRDENSGRFGVDCVVNGFNDRK